MSDDNNAMKIADTPKDLETILVVIGGVIAIACAIAAMTTWPEYARSSVEYIVPVSIIFTGVVWCVLFLAVAKALGYLRTIVFLLAKPEQREDLFGDAGAHYLRSETNSEIENGGQLQEVFDDESGQMMTKARAKALNDQSKRLKR